MTGTRPAPGRTRALLLSTRAVLLIGMLTALLLAGGLSYYASSSPDGLEKVASDQGLNARERQHPLADSPLSDYNTRGVSDRRLSGGLAGVVGVVVTLGIAGGVFLLIRRRRPDGQD